jgi:hypothetical protein
MKDGEGGGGRWWWRAEVVGNGGRRRWKVEVEEERVYYGTRSRWDSSSFAVVWFQWRIGWSSEMEGHGSGGRGLAANWAMSFQKAARPSRIAARLSAVIDVVELLRDDRYRDRRPLSIAFRAARATIGQSGLKKDGNGHSKSQRWWRRRVV